MTTPCIYDLTTVVMPSADGEITGPNIVMVILANRLEVLILQLMDDSCQNCSYRTA